MLMGLAPLGSPADWGTTIEEAIYINGGDESLLTGRYVSVIINKATYTGVIVSISGDYAKIYLEEPRESIVSREIFNCNMVMNKGRSKADRTTMKKIEKLLKDGRRERFA